MLFEMVGMIFIIVSLLNYTLDPIKEYCNKYGGRKTSTLGYKQGKEKDKIDEGESLNMLFYLIYCIFMLIFPLVMMLWASRRIPMVTYYFLFLMGMMVIGFMKTKRNIVPKKRSMWQSLYFTVSTLIEIIIVTIAMIV